MKSRPEDQDGFLTKWTQADSGEDLDQECGENHALLPDMSASWTRKLFSFTYVVLMILAYAIALISFQISGLTENIFLLSSIIYVIQVPLAVCTARYTGISLRINRKDLGSLLWLVVCTLIYTPSFYGAAIFMAVGNLDALHNAFFIIFTTCVDFIKGVVSRLRVFIACFVVIGAILLAQPWEKNSEINTKHVTPCDYIEHADDMNRHNNSTFDNSSFDITLDGTDSGNWYLYHKVLIGYMLLIIAATTYTVQENVTKAFIAENPLPALIFWSNLLASIITFIISIIWVTIEGVNLFTFPSGLYCLLFTVLYIIFAALGDYLAYNAIEHFQVSTYSASYMLVSCMLYASQRTFLKAFHPGHANMTEIFGIMIVVCGTASIPVLEVLTGVL